MNYVALHTHSQYSLLDGFASVQGLAQVASEYEMPAVALTDHGQMFGLVPFLSACKSAQVKPIMGCETYMADGSRFDKIRKRYHLVLLAKNATGLRNLFHLVSLANIEGFYHKPRIDHELLERHHEGLVALSSCLAGEVPDQIVRGDIAAAEQTARWYKELFGPDYYIELQRHQGDIFEPVLQVSAQLARRLAIPVVATTDAHYLRPEDAPAHQLLLAIATRKTQGESNLEFGGSDYCFYSPAEMEARFPDYPEALANTMLIAEQVEQVKLADTVEVPAIPGITPGTEDRVLHERCLASLKQRYGTPLPPAYQERLDYELGVIKETGFARYMLLVADITDFARTNGIRQGPRGSAAGALVCHGLGISEPDPIRHGLLFERGVALAKPGETGKIPLGQSRTKLGRSLVA